MPAKSKSQQQFMAMVHNFKKSGGTASPAVKKAAAGMTDKAAKDFASTKTGNLPDHVEESFERKLEKVLFTENQSPIDINPKNKGKFTTKAKAAGSSVQTFADKVLNAKEGEYSPTTRKQANFAKNAKSFKHSK
jgi:hypothetical protein